MRKASSILFTSLVLIAGFSSGVVSPDKTEGFSTQEVVPETSNVKQDLAIRVIVPEPWSQRYDVAIRVIVPEPWSSKYDRV